MRGRTGRLGARAARKGFGVGGISRLRAGLELGEPGHVRGRRAGEGGRVQGCSQRLLAEPAEHRGDRLGVDHDGALHCVKGSGGEADEHVSPAVEGQGRPSPVGSLRLLKGGLCLRRVEPVSLGYLDDLLTELWPIGPGDESTGRQGLLHRGVVPQGRRCLGGLVVLGDLSLEFHSEQISRRRDERTGHGHLGG